MSKKYHKFFAIEGIGSTRHPPPLPPSANTALMAPLSSLLVSLLCVVGRGIAFIN